jgi:hypothetical protein
MGRHTSKEKGWTNEPRLGVVLFYRDAAVVSRDQKKNPGVWPGFSGEVATTTRLLEQQRWFPANALGIGLQFLECPVLNLADALFANPEQMTNLPQAVRAIAREAKAQVQHFPFAGSQVFHQELECFLALVVLVQREGLRIRHRFRQFEIAVVVEDSVQAHGSAGCGLQMVQVFQTATSSLGEFLRAGQVLATVGERFALLLQEAKFLEVVRRQADQVALACDGNLERLANPPGCVGGEARTVAHIETVDCLHETADGLLQQIGVREAVVAESLGDVGRQTDVRTGQAVLVVNVSIVQASHCHHFAGCFGAIIADELSHWPGFEWRSGIAEVGEVAEQNANQFVFAVPEVGEQLAFFFGCQQIRGKSSNGCLIDNFG